MLTHMLNKKELKKENGLLNVFFNILIPILILNKLNKYLAPVPLLIIALSFPIGYGSYDLFKRRKFNFFSLMGILNVSLTGTLAILQLGGVWMAIKEAAFPLLAGVFVLASAYTKLPFIETMLLNPDLIKVDLIKQKLQEKQTENHFDKLLQKSTILLACSFVISSVLNFGLAYKIFTPISESLNSEAKAELLNQQIADMTSWSWLITFLPGMLMLVGIFFFVLKGIEKLTDLKQDDLMAD